MEEDLELRLKIPPKETYLPNQNAEEYYDNYVAINSKTDLRIICYSIIKSKVDEYASKNSEKHKTIFVHDNFWYKTNFAQTQ